jgi:Domain of unknown function (DUF4410)
MDFSCKTYVTIAGLLIAPCLVRAQMPGAGRVKVKSVQSYSGTRTLTKPTAIVVYSFAATQEEVELNKSALNRVRMHMKGVQENEKTKLARKVSDSFSAVLIKNLEKTGIPVIKGITGDLPPDNSLAVQGDFMLIDEGNRARRMAIGLGAGASKVEAHVECYLKQPTENAMLTEFIATSESSRKPGAAETMGAGAAPAVAGAVSGATELKQGAEGDADRLAKAIAHQISQALKSQGWIE